MLLQAGKCSVSIHIFTDRLGELWSTANNLLLLSPINQRISQTQKVGIVSVQNYWVCSKLLTLWNPRLSQPVSHPLHPHKSQAIQMAKDATGFSWKEFSPRSQWKHSELKEAKHSPPHIHSLWTEASSPCWGTTGDRHIMSPHCQTAQCCWPPMTPIYKCGLKTCLTHSHHSSRSVLIKLTADKPKRGSASWLVWSDEG